MAEGIKVTKEDIEAANKPDVVVTEQDVEAANKPDIVVTPEDIATRSPEQQAEYEAWWEKFDQMSEAMREAARGGDKDKATGIMSLQIAVINGVEPETGIKIAQEKGWMGEAEEAE